MKKKLSKEEAAAADRCAGHGEKVKSCCIRCSGKGYIAAFAHIHGGICFACNGSGEFSHPAARNGKGGYFEVINEHARWEFRTYRNCCAYAYKKGETVKDMMVQAITGAGRAGTTLFRIRLRDDINDETGNVEIARRIYKAALENIHPDELTDEWLGFTPAACQIDRNRKGVDFL